MLAKASSSHYASAAVSESLSEGVDPSKHAIGQAQFSYASGPFGAVDPSSMRLIHHQIGPKTLSKFD